MDLLDEIVRTLKTDPVKHFQAHWRYRRRLDREGRDGTTGPSELVVTDEEPTMLARIRKRISVTWLAAVAGGTWFVAAAYALSVVL